MQGEWITCSPLHNTTFPDAYLPWQAQKAVYRISRWQVFEHFLEMLWFPLPMNICLTVNKTDCSILHRNYGGIMALYTYPSKCLGIWYTSSKVLWKAEPIVTKNILLKGPQEKYILSGPSRFLIFTVNSKVITDILIFDEDIWQNRYLGSSAHEKVISTIIVT